MNKPKQLNNLHLKSTQQYQYITKPRVPKGTLELVTGTRVPVIINSSALSRGTSNRHGSAQNVCQIRARSV